MKNGGLRMELPISCTAFSPRRRNSEINRRYLRYDDSHWRRRLLPFVVNCSDEDSLHSKPLAISSNEEEFDDLGVRAALSLLKFYRREISPLLPRSCRFVPTCSEYSMIAYKKYGFVKGTVLTTWRICRCNPLGGYGFDPPRWFDEPP